MNAIKRIFENLSKSARAKRSGLFRSQFRIDRNTRILDLGSEDGSHLRSVLGGSNFDPSNVYIADIDPELIERGRVKYGFNPVLIDESDRLPFEDGFFDIVYCSSVIEHVTVEKSKVWTMLSGKAFRKESLRRQWDFADEARRLGKAFYVQTPYKHFPIESHSWLPLVNWFPRRFLVFFLRFTNRFWVKQTTPDWHLLNKKQMRSMFGGCPIFEEKSLFMTKSLMAIYK